MAYTCTFMDSETYSADDVNNVFAKLTTQGVSLFNNTGNPLVDINTAVSNLTSEGVTLDGKSCKVVKSDGTYMISKGTAIMSDGSMITFDDDGYVLEITDGVLQYISLKHNLGTNTIDVIISENEPTDGELILAQINENGVITDKRIFSKSKFLFPASTNYKIFENLKVEVPYYTGPVSFYEPYSGNVLDTEGDYNYVCLTEHQYSEGAQICKPLVEGGNIIITDAGFCNFYLAKNGSEITVTGNQDAAKVGHTTTITLIFM